MSFLMAEWRKLAIANYNIDPIHLNNLIPAGTQLDYYTNSCLISLVGFRFVNTKLLGFKIPGHINFDEVNLRFYVKRKEGDTWKRGVVFIKEIVPKPALSFIANMVYKEKYITLPMKSNWDEKENELLVSYNWRLKSSWQKFQVYASPIQKEITPNSLEEFITEHYWGYTRINNNLTFEYEVTHPRWSQYKVKEWNIEVDFERTYGSQFGFLNKLEPTSVMLAEGSQITVEHKRKIRIK